MTQVIEIWQASNNINIDYANYQATVNESVNYNWSGTHVFSLSNAIQITGTPNPSLNPTANSLILGVNYDNDGLADIVTSDINGFGFYIYENISGNKSYTPVLKVTDTSLDIMSGSIFLPSSSNSIYYEPNGLGNFPLQVIFGEANFIQFQFFDASAIKHVPLQINYNNNYEVMTLNNTLDDGINGNILTKGSIFLNGNSTDLFSTANTWTAGQTFSGNIVTPVIIVDGGGDGSNPPFYFSSAAPSGFNPGGNIGIWLNAGYGIALNAGSGGVFTQNGGATHNTLDDGSGNMSIAGNISTKHDYDITDYDANHTATDWVGTATLGARNTLTFNTGKTTLVFYNYYGGATPTTTGTINWNHGNDDSGMALVESGATFNSTANCTYFWIAL